MNSAPLLRQRLLSEPAETLLLRLPVRAVEAWLLADRTGISRFLNVSIGAVTRAPDTLHDPKLELANLARTSRKPAIVRDFVPEPGVSSRIGPGYTGRIIEFATEHWNVPAAMEHSESLARAVSRLVQLRQKF